MLLESLQRHGRGCGLEIPMLLFSVYLIRRASSAPWQDVGNSLIGERKVVVGTVTVVQTVKLICFEAT